MFCHPANFTQSLCSVKVNLLVTSLAWCTVMFAHYVVRRFALTVMVFVNYGGGGYWFFQHAPWNGKKTHRCTSLLLHRVLSPVFPISGFLAQSKLMHVRLIRHRKFPVGVNVPIE